MKGLRIFLDAAGLFGGSLDFKVSGNGMFKVWDFSDVEDF